VVDYDRLLDDPLRELDRMVKTLGMSRPSDKEALDEYRNAFLEDRLRHTRYRPEDVEADPTVPDPVRKAVRLMETVTRGDLPLEDAAVADAMRSLGQQLAAASPAFAYIDLLDRVIVERDVHIGAFGQAAAERDERIAGLDRMVKERDGRLNELGQAVIGRDEQVASLEQMLAERDIRITELGQAAVERGGQIAVLEQMLMERDTRIADLGQAMAARDKMIAGLEMAGKERDTMVAELTQAAAGRDGRIAILERAAKEREGRIAELTQAAAGRDNQIAELARTLAERDGQVTSLDQSLKERDGLITGLNYEVAARDARIRQLSEEAAQLAQERSDSKARLEAIESSPVWRLAGPVFELLQPAGQRGFRREFRFSLAANDQLKPRDAGEHAWESVGLDPHFHMEPADGRYPSGWVLLDTWVTRQGSDLTLRLYFDRGQGLNEADSVVVPVSMKGRVLEVLQLPPGVRALRWDPMQCPGALEQAPIRIVEIGAAERIVRMLVRVLPMYWKLGSAQRRIAGLRASRVLHDLQGAYLAAGELRNHRVGHLNASVSYDFWIALNDTLKQEDRERIRSHSGTFPRKPLISVLMPTYNPPAAYLREAIESVVGQLYENWELCIADDASTEPHVKAILEEFRARDPRIKIHYRETNGHISAASNSALALATGEYVALLDHDDRLAEHALYHAAARINETPEARVLYSDEDKLDETGRRFDPHFKPDWNPDLLRSQNYVSHLGIYATALVRQVGAFRLGYEGSQDYDLLLRCVACCGDEEIVHIPKILYHWRSLAGSTARDAGEKRYTTDAGISALQDHFVSLGKKVHVQQGIVANTYRVRHAIPQPAPLVSLLIPTRDRLDLIRACVESILEKTAYANYEILILDNQSTEPQTLEWFAGVDDGKRVRVLRYDHPFNYSAINNFGVEHARGEIVGLVNNDIEVIGEEWLTEMVSHAQRPEIGCVGAKLYYENDNIQHAGVILGLGGVAGHSHKYFPRKSPGYFYRLHLIQNLSAVTAACMLVRKSVYKEVGGLNEDDLKVAFNDVDFCLRVRVAGYRNLWTPYAELYHHESISRGAEDTPEKQARFAKEVAFMKTNWADALNHDPAYSENLTRDREDFSIA
jgi:glycosyltransferase involved in cell wall biosynthesis